MLGASGLKPGPVPVLGVVALVLIIIDPSIVIDVGAWLSFGATLAIVLCAARLARVMGAPSGIAGGLRRRALTVVSILLAATIAAELALLPIAAGVFGRVGAAGLVLNFIAIPAMAIVQIAGGVTVVLGTAGAPAAGVAGWIAHGAARALVDSSRLVEVAPWLTWRTAAAPLVWTAAYYAFWIAFLSRPARDRLRRLSAMAAIAAGLLIAASPITGGAPPHGRLRVSWLDVGQADAAIVQFPSGRSMLIDAGGGATGFDVGSRVVAPAAGALGIRRLDWFVLTHADVDHAGGALSSLDLLRPREIWEGIPVPASAARRQLRQAAARDGIAWRRVIAGDAVETGAVVLDVLHPPPPDWERQRVRNDDSVVIRLRYGDVEVLLTGDAGIEFERAFHLDGDARLIRVLKVAHHGSRTSSSSEFVAAYRPSIAVVSAGRGNLFGHPAPEVVARLEAFGAELFRTDADGAVILETDGRTVEMTTAAGRRRVVATAPARP